MATYRDEHRYRKLTAESPEKPYQMIPFYAPEPRRDKPPGHAALAQPECREALSGVIDFSLITLTPLHVALGIVGVARSKREEAFAALPVVTRRYDGAPGENTVRKIPVLPGSSFKGAVRALAEALSPSCIPIVSGDLRRQLDQKHPFRICNNADRLCPACRLFGNTQYAGHVAVSDVHFTPADLRWHRSPLLWKPGRGPSLRRRYTKRGQPAGRKVYYHRAPAEGEDLRVVIRPNATTNGRLSFAGVQPADLGLLLAAMGADGDQPFAVKIGGGKPVGLGSVSIRIRSVVVRDGTAAGRSLRQTGRLGTSYPSSNDAEERLTGETLGGWIRQQVQAALDAGVLLPDALQQLRSVLDPKGLEKPAPDQAY